jgi:hypothetical protein
MLMKTIFAVAVAAALAVPAAAQQWSGGGPLFDMYQQNAQPQQSQTQPYSPYGYQGNPPPYETSNWAPQGGGWNGGWQDGPNGPQAGWRGDGRDDRRFDRRCNGTTGAVIGGVAGGTAGAGIGGRRNRTLGAILGGVAGAVVGSSIDKNNCRRQQNRWDGDGNGGW